MRVEMDGYLFDLNDEEIAACKDIIKKMRNERHRKEVFEENREWLRSAVSAIIDAIGIEDTKRILREINQDLRRKGGNPLFARLKKMLDK